SVQRKFTKSLAICPSNASYGERLVICGLTSLEQRRLIADLTLFYKIINKLVTIDLRNTIIPYPANYITRAHTRRNKIPPARTNSRLHFFTHRTIRAWNKLSEPTVSAPSLNDFKVLLGQENLSGLITLYTL